MAVPAICYDDTARVIAKHDAHCANLVRSITSFLLLGLGCGKPPVLCADSADGFQRRRAAHLSLCRLRRTHIKRTEAASKCLRRAYRAVYSQSFTPGPSFSTWCWGGLENQFRLLASGLRLRMRMNKKESEEIKKELAMRVVQGRSQFSASDLPVSTCGALSAQNEKHRVRNIVLV
jgi:hypothetical protein